MASLATELRRGEQCARPGNTSEISTFETQNPVVTNIVRMGLPSQEVVRERALEDLITDFRNFETSHEFVQSVLDRAGNSQEARKMLQERKIFLSRYRHSFVQTPEGSFHAKWDEEKWRGIRAYEVAKELSNFGSDW